MTFAKAGEVVTCENGHPVYELRTDLAKYEALSASAFKGLGENADPIGGQQIKKACDCGAPFMRYDAKGGWHIRFADGWRP